MPSPTRSASSARRTPAGSRASQARSFWDRRRLAEVLQVDEGQLRILLGEPVTHEGGATQLRDVLKLGIAVAAAPDVLVQQLREAAVEATGFTARSTTSALGRGVVEHLQLAVAHIARSCSRAEHRELYGVAAARASARLRDDHRFRTSFTAALDGYDRLPTRPPDRFGKDTPKLFAYAVTSRTRSVMAPLRTIGCGRLRTMSVYPHNFDKIADGTKTIEVRVAYPNNRSLAADQLLRFMSGDRECLTKVVRVKEALGTGWRRSGPRCRGPRIGWRSAGRGRRRCRPALARLRALSTDSTVASGMAATPWAWNPRTSRRMSTASWRGGRTWGHHARHGGMARGVAPEPACSRPRTRAAAVRGPAAPDEWLDGLGRRNTARATPATRRSRGAGSIYGRW